MTAKIEEVARAIRDAAIKQRVSFRDWGGQSGIVPALNMNDIARAAIEAMREPNEAMSKAAYEADGTSMMLAIAYEDVWRAMIDAALAEGPK